MSDESDYSRQCLKRKPGAGHLMPGMYVQRQGCTQHAHAKETTTLELGCTLNTPDFDLLDTIEWLRPPIHPLTGWDGNKHQVNRSSGGLTFLLERRRLLLGSSINKVTLWAPDSSCPSDQRDSSLEAPEWVPLPARRLAEQTALGSVALDRHFPVPGCILLFSFWCR